MGVSDEFCVCPETEFLELLKKVPGIVDIEFIPADERSYIRNENEMIDTWSIA